MAVEEVSPPTLRQTSPGPRERHENKDRARDALRKSAEADSRFLKPYLPLSVIAFDERNWPETLGSDQRA